MGLRINVQIPFENHRCRERDNNHLIVEPWIRVNHRARDVCPNVEAQRRWRKLEAMQIMATRGSVQRLTIPATHNTTDQNATNRCKACNADYLVDDVAKIVKPLWGIQRKNINAVKLFGKTPTGRGMNLQKMPPGNATLMTTSLAGFTTKNERPSC